MPLKIVYLDDEVGLCEVFMEYFSSENVEIKIFSVPAEAIDEINTNPPDVIFLDYRLPGTTGDLIAQSLDPKIPKYLITGELEVNTQYKFEKVFSKPFVVNEIEEVINHYESIPKHS